MGILNASGGNFGLGRTQPTREQGLGLLSLLAGLTPAGDVMQMGQGMMNRNPLEFGLGAGSLLLPGTIKPEMVKGVFKKAPDPRERYDSLMEAMREELKKWQALAEKGRK